MDVGTLTGTLELKDEMTGEFYKAQVNFQNFGKVIDQTASSVVSSVGKMENAVGSAGGGFDRFNDKVEKLINKLSGAELQQGVNELQQAMQGLYERGQLSEKAMQNLGNAAAELQKKGASLTPELAHLAEGGETSATAFEGMAAAVGELVGGIVVAIFSFQQLKKFLQESIAAAAEAEMSQVKLTSALKAQSMGTPEVIGQMGALADSYAKTTLYTKTQIQATEQMLVQVGGVMPGQMDKALEATTNLAAGMGVDLETAARRMSAAAEGNIGQLKKYIPTIDEARAKTEGLAYVMGVVTEKFGGDAAAQVNTYEGSLTQLGKTWGDLEESVGNFIVKNPAVILAINATTAAIDDQVKKLKLAETAWEIFSTFAMIPTDVAIAKPGTGQMDTPGAKEYAAALAAVNAEMDRLNLLSKASSETVIVQRKTVANLDDGLVTLAMHEFNLGETAKDGAMIAKEWVASISKQPGVSKEVIAALDGMIKSWEENGKAAEKSADKTGKAALKSADEVDKMVDHFLGIPHQTAEAMAALEKVVAIPDLSPKTIKAVVDELDKMQAAHQKLSPAMQEFLKQNEQYGTVGEAARKTMQGYTDAAKSTHDNLTLVGLDLKNAQLAMQRTTGERKVTEDLAGGKLSPQEAAKAIQLVDQRAYDESLKAKQDFDKQMEQEVETSNRAVLAAHQSLVLNDLELTNVQLDNELEAAKKSTTIKYTSGKIDYATYRTELDNLQKIHDDKSLKASITYNEKIAGTSAKHLVDLIKLTQDYNQKDAAIGMSTSEQAQVQLDKDYQDRIAALGSYEIAVKEGMTEAWDTAAAAVDRWYLHEKDALERTKDPLAAFNLQLGGLAQTIAQLAQISGGSFGGVMKGVGEIVGHAQVAAQAASSYRAASQAQADTQHKYDQALKGGDANEIASAASNLKATKITSTVGKVGAVAQGAMSVWSATEGGGAKGITGGAMAGFEAGSAFGPWGMAIGAAAGALVGVAKSFSNNTKKAREDFAKTMGKDSLGGLYDDLAKMGKKGEELANQGQHVIGKKDDAANKKWMDDVKKFYDDIQKSLGEMGTATGLWNEQQEAVAKNAKETGENLEAVNAARAQQAQKAGVGLAAGLSVAGGALQSHKDLQAQIATTTDQTQLDALTAQLKKVDALYDITKIHSQNTAKAISSSMLGVVMSQIKAGASFTEAIRGAGPAIESLGKQLADTGFKGGQAFDFLAQSAAIVNDEITGPALDAAAGYADALVGLANAGLMDQDTFSGLTEQIGGTTEALEKQGFSHGAVMAAMQTDLQKVWEMQQKYGYSVDDSTQKLIDEGVQSGLIGEQGKSDNQKILDVLMAIGEALGAVIPEGLKTMTSAGDKAAKDTQKNMKDMSDQMAKDVAAGSAAAGGSLGNIAKHTPTSIDIPVNLVPGEDASPTGSGFGHAQTHTGGGIVYAQSGAKILPFSPRGTDTVPAMLTPGERVLTVDETKKYDTGQGGEANLHITLVIPDGDVLLKQVVKARKRLG